MWQMKLTKSIIMSVILTRSPASIIKLDGHLKYLITTFISRRMSTSSGGNCSTMASSSRTTLDSSAPVDIFQHRLPRPIPFRSIHLGRKNSTKDLSSERSFSARRRIKTYLQSTTTQEKFNNLMVCICIKN